MNLNELAKQWNEKRMAKMREENDRLKRALEGKNIDWSKLPKPQYKEFFPIVCEMDKPIMKTKELYEIIDDEDFDK